jgi:hypothetical protein
MTQNFIDISAKGNYNVITTGWIDLETRKKNYTGQFDFPKEKTSFIGYKDLSQDEVLTTGVAITCDAPYKRINMRAQIRTTNPDGESEFIDNLFMIDGSEVPFFDFVQWLYVFTGTSNVRTA